MLRAIPLVCSKCGKNFAPTGQLFYKDDFTARSLRDTHLICADCVKKWEERWKLADAKFSERDYVLTVTLTLRDGTEYKNLDAEVLDGTVVTGEDIPESVKRELYDRYVKWAEQRAALIIKDCFFTREGSGLYARCTTEGGTEYPRIALSLDENSELVCNPDVPEYVREQLTNAFNSYMSQEHMLNIKNQPQPRGAMRQDALAKRAARRGFVPGKPESFF